MLTKRIPFFRLAWLSRLNIWSRLALVLSAGFLTLFGVFAFVSLRVLGDSTRPILTERQVIAQMAARRYDEMLSQAFFELDQAAAFARFDPAAPDLSNERKVLAYAFAPPSNFTLGVLFLDARGRVIQAEPPQARPAGADLSAYPFVARTMRTLQRNISDPFRDPQSNRPAVAFTLPVVNADGRLISMLSGWIDLSGASMLNPIEQARSLGESGHAELVDAHGTVVASTEGEAGLLKPGEHLAAFLQMLAARSASVQTVSEDSGPRAGELDVMAFAPLNTAPWGVEVGGTAAETFAGTSELQRDILVLGTLSFAVIFVTTLWGARQLVRPVKVLTGAALRIEQGDLSSPIQLNAGGELGTLARSFESMRSRLQQSHSAETAWNSELEARVLARTRELEALNSELQRSESTRRQLLERVIDAQEEERRRLARELHDGFAQSLTALSMTVQSAAETLPTDMQILHNQLDILQTLVTSTLAETSQWIQDLRPHVLDDLGLVAAVQSYAEARLELCGTHVIVQSTGLRKRLPSELEITLFRVVQEAVSNIARHAHARTASIDIDLYESGHVVLRIEDNGEGFIPAQFLHPTHNLRGIGLLGMRERVALAGGTVTIDSTPRRGTRVRVEMPVNGITP